MTECPQKTHGQCRCGQVQFEIAVGPLMTMACHCSGCQKMSSSAFSLSSLYPSAAFEITEGEPVIGGMHGPTRHFFCPYCMTWLFTRPEGLDDFVNVRTTMLDDLPTEPPFLEANTDEKLPWAVTSAVYSYGTVPAMDDFPDLLAKFAGRASHG